MNEFENGTVTAEEADDWSDIDLSDLTDTEESIEPKTAETAEQSGETEDEANQPTSDGDSTAAETETDAQPADEFVLKHLGTEQTVNREEVIALAQQGLDYARIKGKLHTAEAENAEKTEKLSYFEKLAERQGVSLDEFIEMSVASLRADEQKISYDEALRDVRFEFEKNKFAKEKSDWEKSRNSEKTADDARQADIDAFMAKYPEAAKDPNAIPKEVWQEAETAGLTQAYGNYLQRQKDAEIASLRKQLEQEKQYNKNKESSTGSQATSGTSATDAAFDALWAD